MPEAAQAVRDPGTKTRALEAAIAAQSIAIQHVDHLDGGTAHRAAGGFQILNGLAPAAEVSVLVHEHAQLCSAVRYVRCLHTSSYRAFASWMRNKVTTKAGNKTAASAKLYHIGNAVSRVIGAPKYVDIWMGTLITMNPKMNIERFL